MGLLQQFLHLLKSPYGAFLAALIILILFQLFENVLWLSTLVIIYAYLLIFYVSAIILGGGRGIANSRLLSQSILHKGWAFSLFILIVIGSAYFSNSINELVTEFIASIVSSLLGQNNITVTQSLTSLVAVALLYLNFNSLFYKR